MRQVRGFLFGLVLVSCRANLPLAEPLPVAFEVIGVVRPTIDLRHVSLGVDGVSAAVSGELRKPNLAEVINSHAQAFLNLGLLDLRSISGLRELCRVHARGGPHEHLDLDVSAQVLAGCSTIQALLHRIGHEASRRAGYDSQIPSIFTLRPESSDPCWLDIDALLARQLLEEAEVDLVVQVAEVVRENGQEALKERLSALLTRISSANHCDAASCSTSADYAVVGLITNKSPPEISEQITTRAFKRFSQVIASLPVTGEDLEDALEQLWTAFSFTTSALLFPKPASRSIYVAALRGAPQENTRSLTSATRVGALILGEAIAESQGGDRPFPDLARWLLDDIVLTDSTGTIWITRWETLPAAQDFARAYRPLLQRGFVEVSGWEVVASVGDCSQLRFTLSWLRRETEAAFYAMPSDTADGTRTEASAASMADTFTLERDAKMILLPVTLFGVRRLFVFDTGANVHVFDRSLVPYLGEPLGREQMELTVGSVQVESFRSPRAWIGSFPLVSREAVACVDLGSLRAVTGQPLFGIIGTPFLKGNVIEFDPEDRKLSITTSAEAINALDWHSLPLRLDSGYLWITVALEPGAEEEFRVDTGQEGAGNLRSATFERLKQLGLLLESDGAAHRVIMQGTTTSREGILREFGLGPFVLRGLKFDKSNENSLGFGTLKRFKVIIDIACNRIYLKKANGYDEPERTNLYGLYVLRDSRTRARKLAPDSPALRAGIQPGDVLLQVQGRPVSDYSVWQLENLMQSVSDKAIVMDLRRKRHTYRVSLSLIPTPGQKG